MVIVAQLVRASDCGSEGCGFKSHRSPRDPKRSLYFKRTQQRDAGAAGKGT